MSASQFNTISSRQYSHMKARFKPKMSKSTGLLRVPGRELPFTLAQLRDWLVEKATYGSATSLLKDPDTLVFKCAYCTKPLILAEVELDHIEPVKRGGSLALINLAIACKLCNQTKGELTAEEYRALISGLETFPHAARAYILKCLRTAAMGARTRFFPRDQKGPADATSNI